MQFKRTLLALLAWLAGSSAFGCSGGEGETASQTGGTVATSTGGATATGGSTSSGSQASTGGTLTTGGASGGNTAAGGSPAGGGSLATGGLASGGLATGGAASEGTGAQAGTGGSAAAVECGITTTTSAPSPDVGSVGVVEFATDLANPSAAHIEFGLTTDYGMSAEVDMAAADYRTLLLGLPFGSELNYRINVENGTASCQSENLTMTLGAAPAGVSAPVTVQSTGGMGQEPIGSGYVLSAVYQSGVVFITNLEGELVWLLDSPLSGVSQARMSYDAKHIFVRTGNPSGTAGGGPGGGGPGGGGGGEIIRISVDGASQETIEAPTSHHDLTVLPNGSLVYLRRSETVTNCDVVVEHTVDGQETVLYEFADAFPSFSRGGTGDDCHVNAVRYNEHDQTLNMSSLMLDSMINVGLDGSLNWVVGGNDPTLDMGGLSWDRQHGMHMPDAGTMYFFNNGGNTQVGDGNSVVLKMLISADSVALDDWFYDSNNQTGSQGDVQVLPNENVLITYSNDGVSHEVNPEGNLVRTFEYAGPVGYANFRTSLYGPPRR